MPGDESPLTNPLLFTLVAVVCIAAGLVSGWGIWTVLEPHHLNVYQRTMAFSLIIFGAAAVGVTPYVVPWFLRECGFLQEDEEK